MTEDRGRSTKVLLTMAGVSVPLFIAYKLGMLKNFFEITNVVGFYVAAIAGALITRHSSYGMQKTSLVIVGLYALVLLPLMASHFFMLLFGLQILIALVFTYVMFQLLLNAIFGKGRPLL